MLLWWFELVYAFLDENNVWHESYIRLEVESQLNKRIMNSLEWSSVFCELNGFVHKIYSPQQNSIVEL